MAGAIMVMSHYACFYHGDIEFNILLKEIDRVRFIAIKTKNAD